jgi:hypothetical protein
MFDQFQQTMMMMVQMFSSMHRDQFGLLREELDRVQQLSQELATLQAELSRQPAPATPPAPVTPRVRQTAPARAGRLFAGRNSGTPPTKAVASAAAKMESAPPDIERAVPNTESSLPNPPPEKTNGEHAPNDLPPSTTPPPEDVHAWLRDRIEAIQQERQTRWQKILGFLSGKRPGE